MYAFIQQNQGLLMGVFFLLALGSFAVAVFFGVLIRHTEKKADQRLKQARADITDMTILFQTMRDIIGQQKALAKDFNEELEHKMEQVKHILNQGMEKNKQLYDKQQRIAMELDEAQARVDGLYRQLAQTPKAPAPNGSPTPVPPRPPAPVATAPATLSPRVPRRPEAPSVTKAPAPRDAAARAAATPPMDPRDVPPSIREPLLRPARPLPPAAETRVPALSPEEEARFADTGVTRAPFTSWIAEDLLERKPRTGAPEPSRQNTPDPADQGPGNGDAAREAFRALLNMPATPDRESAPLDVIPADEDWPVQPESDSMTIPLQQRVLEYSEAGMTVAQVSRELGIGKGEVRLMLSLARQQAPPQA